MFICKLVPLLIFFSQFYFFRFLDGCKYLVFVTLNTQSQLLSEDYEW